MKTLRKLHIYISLVACAFLFFICFFGTSAYFKDEINYYMQPNIQKASKNNSTQSLESTVNYALNTYKDYEFINIKTPSYYSNLYEISFYDTNTPKGQMKKNTTYFSEENFSKNSTLGSKFLIGLHYKLLPNDSLKDIFKAIISVFAFLMLVLVISGFFIWNKKLIFNFKNKNNFANLFNFHNVAGVFIGVFLAWLSISGLGLNYLKDIEKIFSSSTQTKAKQNNAKGEYQKQLFDYEVQNILKAVQDAKTRLNSEDLSILISKPSKSINISNIKNDKPFSSIFVKNSNILVYSSDAVFDETASNKASLKNTNFFGFLNDLFFNTHRVHFAPFILQIMLFVCGAISCVFIYKAMLLSAAKRKDDIRFIALANGVLSACVNATLVYFIMNKILDNAEPNRQLLEQNAFYIAFVLSFILSFIFAKKTKFLKLISVILFVILLLCDAIYSHYTGVTIAFNMIYLFAIFVLLRGFNASANS